MKKFIAILSCCLAFCAIQASVPNKMKHQGAIYLLTNRPLINQNVVIKVSIEKENAGGEVVFSETHNLTTDNFGYFQLEIGSGNVLLGNFTLIDWSSGNYFVKTEYSSDNGTTYSTIGNSQLLSVPYAYCAGNFSKFPQGNAFGDMLFWENEQWNILPIGSLGQYLGIKNGEQTPSWIDIPNCKLDALRQYGEAPTEGNTSENTNFPYIGYQIVARNQQQLYVNRTMDVKISILKGSNNGAVVYQETFEAASDANGIVSLMIGSGEPLTGSFQLIDWSSGNYFIQYQIDPNRTDNYTISNTEPILSVPYAFCVYSENMRAENGDLLFWNGNNWASLPVGNENDILVVAKNNTPTWIAPEVVSDDFEQLPNMSGVVDSILFSRYDTTQLSLSSSQVSRILIAQYPDGSKKYVDGAIIGETGLLLQMDNDYPERRKDTIWAKTEPVEGLVADWKIADESVLKIVETSQLPSYIVVEALKKGNTKVYAQVEDNASDTIDVIVDSRYVKSLRYVVQGPVGTYEAESTTGTLYDVDPRAKNNPAERKDQYTLTVKVDAEENGGPSSFPVTWEIVGDVDTINDLKLTYTGENKETVMIETRKGDDGKGLIERLNKEKDPASKDYIRSLDVTVRARSAYFSVDALLSIKPKNGITPIESVDWKQLYGDEAAVMTEVEIETSSKYEPAPILLTALGNPSVVDHLVGGYRFGIVGKDGYLDNSAAGNIFENEFVRLESTDETKEGGKVGIRGLKAGIVKIWVEIGDAALEKTLTGKNFTEEEYGAPVKTELTVNIVNVVSSLKVYKEENMSTEIGTNMQKLTVGDNQVFVAQIEDEAAHKEFKGNVEWIIVENDNNKGAISISQDDPTDKTRVTVTANSAATGNAAPKLYAKVTDSKGKETISGMFPIEVEEAASDEASDLEFTSATARWEEFADYGLSAYYTYVFTTAAGDELVIPAANPTDMGMGYDGYMFGEDRTWTIGENGDEDIFIVSGPGIGITISASGTEYRIKSGSIVISGGGASAQIDLIAVPIVGGVEGTETPVTGTWSGIKPADPRP